MSQSVQFDGSASDFDKGLNRKYHWDLDGDHTYETETSTPKVSHKYGVSGQYKTGLIVTDSTRGLLDWSDPANLVIAVGTAKQATQASQQSRPLLASDCTSRCPTADSSQSAEIARGSSFRFRPGVRLVKDGLFRQTGNVVITTGVVQKGTVRVGGSFLGPPGKLKWAVGVTAKRNIATDAMKLDGYLLINYRKGNRTCLSMSWAGNRKTGKNTGKFRAVAGTKQAARLAGTGRFRIDVKAPKLAISGRQSLRDTKKRTHRRVPRVCRGLAKYTR